MRLRPTAGSRPTRSFSRQSRPRRTTNTLIRLFVGLSVAFGIAAVLVVSVIQRSKEIGILRAMGTSRGQILRVFLLQGGLLGFVGSLFGAALGARRAHATGITCARQADGIGAVSPDPGTAAVRR